MADINTVSDFFISAEGMMMNRIGGMGTQLSKYIRIRIYSSKRIKLLLTIVCTPPEILRFGSSLLPELWHQEILHSTILNSLGFSF